MAADETTWEAVARFRDTGDDSGLDLLRGAPEGAPVLEALREADDGVARAFAISLWHLENTEFLGLDSFPAADLDMASACDLVEAFRAVSANADDAAPSSVRRLAGVGYDFLQMVRGHPEELSSELQTVSWNPNDLTLDGMMDHNAKLFAGSKDLSPREFVHLLPRAGSGLFTKPWRGAGEGRALVVASLGGKYRPRWWGNGRRPAMMRLAYDLVRAADADLTAGAWRKAVRRKRPLTPEEDLVIADLIVELLGTRAWNGLAFSGATVRRRPGLAVQPYVDEVEWRIGEWAAQLGSNSTARMAELLRVAASNSDLGWVEIVKDSGLPKRLPGPIDLAASVARTATAVALGAGVAASVVIWVYSVYVATLGDDWFGLTGPLGVVASFFMLTPALWATAIPLQRSRYKRTLPPGLAWLLSGWVALCWSAPPVLGLVLLDQARPDALLGVGVATLYVLFLSAVQLKSGRPVKLAFPTVSDLIAKATPDPMAPPGSAVPDIDGYVAVIELGQAAAGTRPRA